MKLSSEHTETQKAIVLQLDNDKPVSDLLDKKRSAKEKRQDKTSTPSRLMGVPANPVGFMQKPRIPRVRKRLKKTTDAIKKENTV